MQVERVQKWVMSGLLVIAGVVGLMAISGVRVINAKPVASLWLLLGLLPAAVGSYFRFVA